MGQQGIGSTPGEAVGAARLAGLAGRDAGAGAAPGKRAPTALRNTAAVLLGMPDNEGVHLVVRRRVGRERAFP